MTTKVGTTSITFTKFEIKFILDELILSDCAVIKKKLNKGLDRIENIKWPGPLGEEKSSKSGLTSYRIDLINDLGITVRSFPVVAANEGSARVIADELLKVRTETRYEHYRVTPN